MLFCSYEFVFLFLPVVLAGYFLIGRFAPGAWARVWLVLASLVFYGLFKAQGIWLYKYLWIILASIALRVFLGDRNRESIKRVQQSNADCGHTNFTAGGNGAPPQRKEHQSCKRQKAMATRPAAAD